MYYFKEETEKVYSEDEAKVEASEKFKKVFGFYPSERVVKEILKNDDQYCKLPTDTTEAIEVSNSRTSGAQLMYGMMEAVTKEWFNEDVCGEARQELCNKTRWTISFDSGEKHHAIFNLLWGPAELETMEELLRSLIVRNGEVSAQ